jgi:hypothetical protein
MTRAEQMSNTPAIFVNQLSTWVWTDVLHYALFEDLQAYMEKRYPTTYDARRKRYVQHYDIKVRRNHPHHAFLC